MRTYDGHKRRDYIVHNHYLALAFAFAFARIKVLLQFVLLKHAAVLQKLRAQCQPKQTPM